MMNRHLNILAQSNDFYAPFAGAMLTSLFENNQNIDCITVYLMISADMSEKNKARFLVLAEQYHRKIKFINAREIDFFLEKYNIPQYHGSYANYYKLFALSSIEDKIDRLIYLDSDMVVTGSMQELMTFDLGDNMLGMCFDPMGSKYIKLIKSNSPFYYNTGMIIFDTKKWLECKGADQIISHLTTVHASYPIVDQDIMNVIFSKSIATVPLKYNVHPLIYFCKNHIFMKKAFGVPDYYLNEIELAELESIILHCQGIFGMRPWHESGKHPYKKVLKKYLNMSPWNDFKFLECRLSTMNKMQRLLFKILPKNLFALINRNAIYLGLLQRARKCEL